MSRKLKQGGIMDDMYKSNVPGPGSHEPKINFESRIGRTGGFTRFGSSKRDGLYKAKASPSPDNYK